MTIQKFTILLGGISSLSARKWGLPGNFQDNSVGSKAVRLAKNDRRFGGTGPAIRGCFGLLDEIG